MTTPTMVDPKGKLSINLHSHPNIDEEDCKQDDILEIDAWMQHFGEKRKAFGPGVALAHYISTLPAGEVVIVHVEYSPNGRYNLFVLQSLSKTLCLSTLAQSANMKMAQAEVTEAKQAKVAEVEFKALQALILAPPPAPAMTTPTMVDPKEKLSINLHSHPNTDEEDCKQDDVLEIDAWMQHFGEKRKAFGPGTALAHYISTLLAGEMAQAKVTEAEQAKVAEVEFKALQALILAPPPAPAMTTPTMVDPKGKLSIDLHSHPTTYEEDCKQDDVLEIDAWMQHFGGKRKAFGPGAALAHYISTLLACEVVIIHAEYSPNGRYNLFALQSLSKTLCLSTLAQSANMKVLIKKTFATFVFGVNFRGWVLAHVAMNQVVGVSDSLQIMASLLNRDPPQPVKCQKIIVKKLLKHKPT
ncbi:hypothetical protein L7F22_011402 [Adiantum nelumboides]|nr:hypothetical protein [Adiantum nelumboides]